MSALAAIDGGQDVNAAYFTCNFGGILPLSYDLYLIEVASHKRLEISELQRDLIYEIGERSGRVFLKNLWEVKISSFYYSNNYKGTNIIYDSLFPGMTEILESGETDFIAHPTDEPSGAVARQVEYLTRTCGCPHHHRWGGRVH